MATSQQAADLLADVLRRSHRLAPIDLVDGLNAAALPYGLEDVVIYVTDYSQTRLVPLPATSLEAAEQEYAAADSMAVDGSVAGRAYARMELVESDLRGRPRMFVPLVSGMERLGVLEAVAKDPVAARQLLPDLASLVAQLLLTKGRHSDYLERSRRQYHMSLAAEMQWALLPPLTFGSDAVVISGLVEPSYEVGGDAFDYSLDAREAAVGIFDAMGHGVQASLLSSLAVGAYRNSRRIGQGLTEVYTTIDRVISSHHHGEAFLTGVLGRLDLETGVFCWVNSGHLPPLLLRGGKVVRVLDSEPGLPLGLGGEPPLTSTESLEPGDRVLFFTDGIVDAKARDGTPFGEERLIEMLRKADMSGLTAAEALRRLKGEILDHQDGDLSDDATVLLLEWRNRDATRFGGS
jgi:serine phosphatase RsbU (regulator of sigma subunit)